jgi:hypothetical protein
MKKTQHIRRLFLLLILLTCLLNSQQAPAQTLYTIATNGLATNRVNLVFFSEGYTSGQLGQFLVDATNAANFLLSAQPYAEYSNYFNVFAIAVASAQSGSDHPADGTSANTYFNSSYDNVSDYIITIPPDPYDTNYNDGQGKIDSLLQAFLPNTNNDLSALLVNDPVQGGSDNYGRVAISSVSGDNYILVHESGHTLGNLGDEYTTPYPGFPDTEEPNTTTQTNISLIKWRAWITNGTPIPTPQTAQYVNTVGLFQGAHYHTNGWYRPTYDSRMQSLQSGSGFGPVNSEALVLAIYGKTRPMDSYSPATNNLSVTSAQMLAFSVSLLKPATHALGVQWLTNGVAVTGATNQLFNVMPAQLGAGAQKVEADIQDGTTLVRTDPASLLKQTNVWTLTVTIPSMQIDSLKLQTNGNFLLRVSGNAPDGVAVQTSTNLLNWNGLQTNPLNNSQFFYTNFGVGTSSLQHFYRTVTPP